MSYLRPSILLVGTLCAIALCACGKKDSRGQATAPAVEVIPPTSDAMREVATGRLALGRIEVENHRFDRALPLCLAALEADPHSEEAALALAQTLTGTAWSFPVGSVHFPFPVRQIAAAGRTHLLVGLGAEAGTVVKWNIATQAIEGILFPVPGEEIRSLVADPSGRSFVVGRAGFQLLCDVATMKPVADLGPLPAEAIPQSATVFSADGVLMAHPGIDADGTTRWHIRATADGGIVRSTEPGETPALAGFLDREGLLLLHADGSRSRHPLNPHEPATNLPLEIPEKLSAAVFAANGGAAMVLRHAEPNIAPEASLLDFGAYDDSLESAAMLGRFPFSATPDVWSGLLREPEQALFRVEGKRVVFLTAGRAPALGTADVISFAHQDGSFWLGQEDGTLSAFRVLSAVDGAGFQGKPTLAAREALRQLVAALSGLDYAMAKHTFAALSETERRDLLEKVDLGKIAEHIPAFPVVAWEQLRKQPRSTSPPAEAIVPLVERIARADATRASWPKLLEKSGPLTLTPWYRELAARLAGSATPDAAVRAIFATGDVAKIQDHLAQLPPSGPQTAAALELALASSHAEWIQAVLLRAENVPPLLQRIARSRIALLENRPADALEGWHDSFPSLAEDRKRHDWAGWEEADFSPALIALRDRVTSETAAVTLAGDAPAERRADVFSRLSQPESLRVLGKARFTAACTEAAEVLARHPENAESALTLTELATRYGGEIVRVLRAEATALGTLQRFPEARDRWVKIISEIPREHQRAGDYAEAAYTAYESQNPAQSMEILTTGTHRFPQDADFALRAGWISLLTGESGQAYRFLVIGRQIGYPAEKEENATALLAIAAARAGATEDSSAFRKELVRLNPRWNDPATLDALAWPEEFKAILRGQPAGPTAGSFGVLPAKPKQ